MKVLLDSGVWWRWVTSQPIRGSLKRFLEDEVSEFYLCPVSVMEIFYKVAQRREPEPDIPDWQNRVLEGFRTAPVSIEAARIAGNWEWKHGDPCDRMIAAVARVEGITLVHTDRTLADLKGFPQKYFRNVSGLAREDRGGARSGLAEPSRPRFRHK